MYLPPHFKEESPEKLQAAIRAAPFAALVTQGSAGMEATHLPLLFDPGGGPQGMLIGHIAKGNPQWKTASPDLDALAIFLGPQSYITPSWYATKRETGKVVPTWNYVAIHAYGRVRFSEDADVLLKIVTRLTDTHEQPRKAPWAVSDAPADFVRAQLKGIVAVEMTVSRLEGKWKVSQNRNAEDRKGVVEGLRADDTPAQAAMADLVAAVDRR